MFSGPSHSFRFDQTVEAAKVPELEAIPIFRLWNKSGYEYLAWEKSPYRPNKLAERYGIAYVKDVALLRNPTKLAQLSQDPEFSATLTIAYWVDCLDDFGPSVLTIRDYLL